MQKAIIGLIPFQNIPNFKGELDLTLLPPCEPSKVNHVAIVRWLREERCCISVFGSQLIPCVCAMQSSKETLDMPPLYCCLYEGGWKYRRISTPSFLQFILWMTMTKYTTAQWSEVYVVLTDGKKNSTWDFETVKA